MKCLIVTGGAVPESGLLKSQAMLADTIIGVDGAADLLAQEGITAHTLIGDFDTASPESVQSLASHGSRVIRLPEHKNLTDTEAAVDLALDAGASEITILGALGSRVDHSLTNIMMLLRAEMGGARCRILDGINELSIATGEYTIEGIPGQTVSILPLTGDLIVTAKGLVYPLKALPLRFGSSRGVSNIMQGKTAHLSISGGYALIVKLAENA